MKMHKNCCHQSCFFGSDMHQIVCRLRPRPHWGSLQRSLRPPNWFYRGGAPGEREGGRAGEKEGGEGKGGEGVPECLNPELASLILNVGPGPPPAKSGPVM